MENNREEQFGKMVKMLKIVLKSHPMVLTDDELEIIKNELKKVSDNLKVDAIDNIFNNL